MYRQRVTVRNGLREEVASDSIWSVHKVWMEGSGNLIQREREREVEWYKVYVSCF